MPRILFLSFYYPPDLSAGSFRASALVEALRGEAGDRLQIDVITTPPNRYHTFQTTEPPAEESDGSVCIRRVGVPSHRSGFSDQARAFAYYAAGVRRLTRGRKYDVVLATSSRLFTATLASSVARRSGSRLYLDMRDIFAETMPALVPSYLEPALRPFVSLCERWTINRADRVNLVSPGFHSWFEARYPGRRFSCYTNGVDAQFSKPEVEGGGDACAEEPLTVLYAGNVGDGQGLHLIVPELARRLRGQARFRIVGDGGRMAALRVEVSGLDNVEFVPPMDRSRLHAAYGDADVLFLHLNRHKPFLRVLPSKVFEYAATGKPIWAGVDGFAADFIAEEIRNAAVFMPCDSDGALRALEKLERGVTVRTDFVRRYDRGRIMREMARDVLSLVPEYGAAR